MKVTPFQYLKQHVRDFRYQCEPKYVREFQRALKAALTRMDQYFTANHLYAVVDYQRMVEKMVQSPTFHFRVEDTKEFGGECRSAEDCIVLSKLQLGYGTQTEGVLCHELIHYFTLGQRSVDYLKDGMRFRQIYTRSDMLPNGTFYESASLEQFTNPDPKSICQVMTVNEGNAFLHGGFLAEGMTELLKQQIYTEKECYHTYDANTRFVKFLNRLTGSRTNLEDFLRCNFKEMLAVFGESGWDEFVYRCRREQGLDTLSEPLDMKNQIKVHNAQNALCRAAMQRIIDDPTKVSTLEYLYIASGILLESGSGWANRPLINQAGVAMCRKQAPECQEQYQTLLGDTLEKMVALEREPELLTLDGYDFTFRQKAKDGFEVGFDILGNIDSAAFPSLAPWHYADITYWQFGDNARNATCALHISRLLTGKYKLHGRLPGQPDQTVLITSMPKGAGIIITDPNGQELGRLDFAQANADREQLSRDLAANFAQLNLLEGKHPDQTTTTEKEQSNGY